MPAFARRRAAALVSLFLALCLLLGAAAYLLGGTPTGRPQAVPYASEAPASGEATPPPITCIVIDAGHGGEDGGASSAAGLVEKDVNLAVAFALKELCELAGIPVIMTRTEDALLYDRNTHYEGRKKVLDLAARRILAEKAAAEAPGGGTCLFVSIHMNAYPVAKYSGMQVWYGREDPRSSEIARAVQEAARPLMPENHRKPQAAGSNIYLLDRIQAPAILVECGFLSNPAEAERLGETAYRRALAMTVFTALAPFLSPATEPPAETQ